MNQTYSRRRFLQNSALFSAGLVASSSLSKPGRAASDEAVTAITIGSGYGGAVTALRLAEAGVNTLVLERGDRWQITPSQDTFCTMLEPDPRSTWRNRVDFFGRNLGGAATGVLEYSSERGITVLTGAGVGGSSIVNNAIMYQPPQELFERVFPRSISYDSMRDYYTLALSMLGASPIPNDIVNTPYYEKYRLFRDQANRAGYPTRFLPLSIDWRIVRQEIRGTRRPSTILGESWYGINSGARNSVDRNYLRRAEQTGNVNILPLHLVTDIEEVSDNRYRVYCNQLDRSGRTIRRKTFTCQYLFLGAGSMGTCRLLVKAKAKGSLPRLSDQVGQGFAGNGDQVATRQNLYASDGNLASGNAGPGGSLLESHENPRYALSLMSLDISLTPDGEQQVLGIGLPSRRGRFVYNAATDSVGLVMERYTPQNRDLLLATRKVLETLDRENSRARRVPSPDGRGANRAPGLASNSANLRPSVTAHPLDGMSRACDDYGRVLGYRGLYVVDGARIPGATGAANPALTITALAERSMVELLKEIA